MAYIVCFSAAILRRFASSASLVAILSLWLRFGIGVYINDGLFWIVDVRLVRKPTLPSANPFRERGGDFMGRFRMLFFRGGNTCGSGCLLAHVRSTIETREGIY